MNLNNSNESIINYINSNFKQNEELENEIYNSLNNLLNTECSKSYTPLNPVTLNGTSNSSDGTSSVDLTYLVPNLFRKCFVQKSVSIPSACPKFINQQNVTNYLPYLIDENFIKSFLYFNFPASYTNYSILNILINARINANILIKKKINTTYGSYTTAQELLKSIYSPTSMLLQLVNFNNFIEKSNNSVLNTEIINSFKVLWDITIYCITYNGNIEDAYAVSNETKNVSSNNITTIDQFTGNNINDIKYSSLNIFQSNDQINTNGLITLFSQNIYKVLEYVLEVYQDILLEIQIFISGGIYCKKDYMNINNIPIILELYENFYNNQIYILSKELPENLPINIIPSVISINTYLSDFNTVYLSNNINQNLLKSFSLNSNEGFNFYGIFTNNNNSNFNTTNYTFYYINIGNPSANKLTNFFNRITYQNRYSNINSFVNDFNFGIINEYQGYISQINATYYVLNNYYQYQSLFPLVGSDTTSLTNRGYSYSYYDDNNILINSIYLLLLTVRDNNLNPRDYGIGCALIYYSNSTYTDNNLYKIINFNDNQFVFYSTSNSGANNILLDSYTFYYNILNTSLTIDNINPLEKGISIKNYFTLTTLNYVQYITSINPSGAINQFINDFNNGRTDAPSYISYPTQIGASYYILNGTFQGKGLYPFLGNDPNNSNCIGYIYSYYDSSNNLISEVYLMLLTYKFEGNTEQAIGCALVYYPITNTFFNSL